MTTTSSSSSPHPLFLFVVWILRFILTHEKRPPPNFYLHQLKTNKTKSAEEFYQFVPQVQTALDQNFLNISFHQHPFLPPNLSLVLGRGKCSPFPTSLQFFLGRVFRDMYARIILECLPDCFNCCACFSEMISCRVQGASLDCNPVSCQRQCLAH